jgi:hypothetical protein
MEHPPKTLLNRGQTFYGTELQHTKHFLGLSRHFTAKPTFVLLAVINVVTFFLLHATEKFLKFSFHGKLLISFAFILHILHERKTADS